MNVNLSVCPDMNTNPYNTEPTTTADIVVPINAKVKMVPKFRKKYFCNCKNIIRQVLSENIDYFVDLMRNVLNNSYSFKTVARIKNNRRQENVEKDFRIKGSL